MYIEPYCNVESQMKVKVQVLITQNSINTLSNQLSSKNSSTDKRSSSHRKRYLSSWDNDPASFYSSYVYDSLGTKQIKYSCWLYKKSNENDGSIMLGCRLCEQYRMIKNKNGKENTWATKGFNVLALDKIKEHRVNEKHKEAEELELQRTSMNQPDWISTRTIILSRQEESIKNLMYSCIYLCQSDHPLNSFIPLCDLLEKTGVKLLPAEVNGVSYRNDCAALSFLQHIASVLHQDLLQKLIKSPVLGFMMDESISRSIEKNCIVYVRYLEDFEPRTSFYGIVNMEGNGSADNIVKRINKLWERDGLKKSKSCWLAADNASTFTSIHDGVAAKSKKQYDMPCLELSTCVAHSYALVGKQSGQYLDDDGKIKIRPFIANFENLLGKIYSFFSRSTCRQHKLKQWYNFLTMPELKFKKLFDIRWLSIRDSLKPIMNNMKPGNQALLAFLEHTSYDLDVTQSERNTAAELLMEILDDRFLFVLHFHFDLHECVSGELTKIMQKDDLSYKVLTDKIADKKEMLVSWTKESNGTYPWGPSLAESKESRDDLKKECCLHIERLLQEVERRFPVSELHRCLSYLFDPIMIEENQYLLNDATFGRRELQYLRRKYEKLSDFDSNNVQTEWESFKSLIISFIVIKTKCERGYSAANRIQTIARSRITNETLECLLTVRLLLTNDIRSIRCHHIVEEAFKSWNNPESSRRLNRMQLMIDVPDDYEPSRQVRPMVKKRKLLNCATTYSGNSNRPKKPRANSMKCANGCGRTISSDDPMQVNAILCCHQHEEYNWVDEEDSCRRWLCNFCRIKLAVPTETGVWFCEDHRDIHEKTEETIIS
ncbi:unnamed protein product [Rotaria magnacalcarata]|uniref:DUF4371 domain-containing protein n=3 Tax=Rotaria magnacalcarata TaxID=392030 RepID=A0A816QD94_9BILA|nr:unnamed protein product [Rotaria magnacalcarata]CAF4233873.1 unnamed protein product [Rotaria magnacalcarata]